MNKPQPKQELVVKILNEDSILITFASSDIKMQCANECPEYGVYMPFANGKEAMLTVFSTFDINDVISYIEGFVQAEE